MLGLSWAGFLVLSGFSCQGTFYIQVLLILSRQLPMPACRQNLNR